MKDEDIVGEAFARTAKRTFDESVERLDGPALSRLSQARHVALAAAGRRAPAAWAWLPAGGAVAAVVAVAVLTGSPEQGARPALPELGEVEPEVLLGEEDMEMLEDLEFYYWMDQLSANASGDA